MANVLKNGIYSIDSTGVLSQGAWSTSNKPLRVKSIMISGTGGSVTFKDNQSTPASEFTLSGVTGQSNVLPFGQGHTFPKGLQVTAISAGCVVTIFL